MSKVDVVIGLGFGDEGKGLCTDYLCSQYSPETTMVVRFNGGQQAGHNVVIDNTSHVHSNFGSGTLRGFPSYFSKFCTIYPANILNEYNVLKQKGIDPKLIIDPFAIVTTPYDVAYNRFLEQQNQHGSCGLGIGTTMTRHNNSGYKLFAIDLLDRQVVSIKLANILTYYVNLFAQNNTSMENIDWFRTVVLAEQKIFLQSIEELFFTGIVRVEELYIPSYRNIIFEGAQGIMLDMDHGFFPNVTYSNTTSKNAIQLCKEWNICDNFSLWYVTRCYQTRHGNGPMTSDQPINLINNSTEINVHNEWQKDFRVAEVDYKLLNHALHIDSLYSAKLFKSSHGNKNLLITCNDQRPEFEFDASKLGYFYNVRKSYSPNTNLLNKNGN